MRGWAGGTFPSETPRLLSADGYNDCWVRTRLLETALRKSKKNKKFIEYVCN